MPSCDECADFIIHDDFNFCPICGNSINDKLANPLQKRCDFLLKKYNELIRSYNQIKQHVIDIETKHTKLESKAKNVKDQLLISLMILDEN